MSSIFAMFPGQGSQSVRMGAELYENYAHAKELFETADKTLGFSLRTLCIDGPEEKLTETAVTQPAILTVSTIAYHLFAENNEKDSIIAAAGHSLGEYSAYVAAGAITFEDAVLLVHKRGRYMQEAVPVGAGKMIAILGKEEAEIAEVLSKVDDIAEIANINAPGQIVVAGSATGIDKFTDLYEGAKIRELAVSAPFHCSLMKSAAESLAKDLDALTINEAAFPVYCNVKAEAVTNPEEIRQALKDQVCGTVRWVECVRNAVAEHKPSAAYEFGSGKVLVGLMKRIDKRLTTKNIYQPE